MSETTASSNLFRAYFRFYYDPKGSARAVLDRRPREATLTAILMLACFIQFLARATQVHLQFASPEDRLELTMEHMVSLLIFTPLFYYAFAAIVRLIARLFGGEADWRASRIAVFWAALVASPVMVVAIIVPILAVALPLPALVVLGQLGGVFLAWSLAHCIAEAFGFKRTWLVLAVLCAPILTLFVVVWAVGS